MNYKTIGELGENVVIGELSKYGLGIAPVLSDNYPFEFIAIAGKNLFKIQVKTSTQNNGDVVSFSLTTSNPYNGNITLYDSTKCDLIICYDMVNDNVFLLEPKDFEKRGSISFRYKKTKNNNHKRVNWYEDYIISKGRIEKIFNFKVPNFKIYYYYGEKKDYSHICEECKREFKTNYKYAKCCSSKCSKIKMRKVIRPSREDLICLIKNNTFVSLGKKYGVSDNAIRKWARNYEIDIRKAKAGIET